MSLIQTSINHYAHALKNLPWSQFQIHTQDSNMCSVAPDALCLDILKICKKLVHFRKILILISLNKEIATINKEMVKGKERKRGQQKL